MSGIRKYAKTPTQSRMTHIFLVGLVMLCIAVVYLSNIRSHPFHWDEHEFIRKGYFFTLLFTDTNLADPRWIQDNHLQPKFGPYTYGGMLYIMGHKQIQSYLDSLAYDSPTSSAVPWWQEYHGRTLDTTSPAIIRAFEPIVYGRYLAAGITIIALFVLILILRRKNIYFALIATILTSTNILVYIFGRRAMTDAMQMLFFLTQLSLAHAFTRVYATHKRTKTLVILSILIGINAAVGTGYKINGILSVLFFLLLYLSYILLTPTAKTIRTMCIYSALSIVSFFLVFIPFHPPLYHAPLRTFSLMITDRLEATKTYQRTGVGYAVVTKREALRLLINETLLPTGRYRNFSIPYLPLDLISFLIGLSFMGTRVYIQWKKQRLGFEYIILLWSAIVWISLVYYLRNFWPRYFITSMICITIVQAYGITTGIQYMLGILYPPIRNTQRENTQRSGSHH